MNDMNDMNVNSIVTRLTNRASARWTDLPGANAMGCCWRSLAMLAVAAGAVTPAASGAESPALPEVLLEVGGEGVTFPLSCTIGANGALICEFSFFDIGFTASGQVRIERDPASQCDRTTVLANCSLSSSSLVTLPFTIEIRVPLTSALPARTEAVASFSGSIMAFGSGEGVLASVEGQPIFSARADGETFYSALAGAVVERSGVGGETIGPVSTADPVGPLVEVSEEVVLRHRFSLSGGLRCGLTSVVIIRAPLNADVNLDGVVDGADIGLILGQWGECGLGDLDESGAVDGADLGAVLAGWGG